MAMQFWRLAAVMLCALAAQPSSAADTFGQAVRKLTRIGTGLNSEGIYLDVDLPMELAANTACPNPKRLGMAMGNAQSKDVLSIALVAMAQSRPIELTYVNNSCSPNGGILVLRAAALVTTP